MWRAACDGMAGRALTLPLPGPHRSVPVWQLTEALMGHVQGHLRKTGDFDAVRRWLARLRRHGPGAARQRAVYERTERLEDVVDALAVSGPARHDVAPDRKGGAVREDTVQPT